MRKQRGGVWSKHRDEENRLLAFFVQKNGAAESVKRAGGQESIRGVTLRKGMAEAMAMVQRFYRSAP